MIWTAKTFLILNLALAFFNVGTIWAHEIDIFRSWKLVSSESFRQVQRAHWRKLPYWVFLPVGLFLIGSVTLLVYHPPGSPAWAMWGSLCCQLLSHLLTALFWGRWQGKLSQDPLGPQSAYLQKILRTHWVRTGLISLSGLTLLAWVLILEG